MPPDASVVIVSYRPGDWLAPCITSALPQADQVVVVDNGSSESEASEVAAALGAEVVRSPANVGFAGGVNLGLRRARGAVIGLLNDDAVAGTGWIETARSVLDDPEVAAVTPKVVLDGTFGEVVLDDEPWFAPGDARPLGRQVRSVTVGGSEVLEAVLGAGMHDLETAVVDGEPTRWRWTAGRRPFYVPLPGQGDGDDVAVDGEAVELRTTCRLVNHAGSYLEPHGVAGEYGLGAPDDGRFDHAAERFGFSATAPVMRASTLEHLGGMVPQFFAYNEDTDWCLRARLAGMKILYEPSASVRHRLSATSGGASSPMVQFLAQRNSLLCLVRNAPLGVARAVLWRRLHEDHGPALRRAVISELPSALAARARMRRLRTTSRRAVWDRWAGVDNVWDDSPAGCARR